MRFLAILLAALILSACAGTTSTLTAAQCDANWGAVGENDGAEGAPRSKLDDYRAACSTSGAPLSARDETAWRRGWRDGVEAFCALPGYQLSDAEIRAQDRICPSAAASAGGVYDDDGYGDGPYGRRRTRRDDHHGGHSHGGPTIRPSIGVGIGSGGGVRGGLGVGLGFPLFDLGLF